MRSNGSSGRPNGVHWARGQWPPEGMDDGGFLLPDRNSRPGRLAEASDYVATLSPGFSGHSVPTLLALEPCAFLTYFATLATKLGSSMRTV